MAMCEILFRGKSIYTGKWAVSVCPHGVMRSGHLCDDFIPDTVGQFTGLTDKNGKKIFEGDIVRFDNRLSVVEYVDCRMGFAFRKTIGHGIVPGFTMPHWETCEILGNIHDNPELLGGE